MNAQRAHVGWRLWLWGVVASSVGGVMGFAVGFAVLVVVGGAAHAPVGFAGAVLGAGIIWYLVQEALGIYLRPLPWFMS